MMLNIEKVIRRNRRRAAAWVCAVVLLFTMLPSGAVGFAEETPRLYCGLEAHRHTPECYDGETLTCALPEHVHTEKCYEPQEDEDVHAHPVEPPKASVEVDYEGPAPEEHAPQTTGTVESFEHDLPEEEGTPGTEPETGDAAALTGDGEAQSAPVEPVNDGQGGETTLVEPANDGQGGETTPVEPVNDGQGGETTPVEPANDGQGGETTPVESVNDGQGGETTSVESANDGEGENAPAEPSEPTEVAPIEAEVTANQSEESPAPVAETSNENQQDTGAADADAVNEVRDETGDTPEIPEEKTEENEEKETPETTEVSENTEETEDTEETENKEEIEKTEEPENKEETEEPENTEESEATEAPDEETGEEPEEKSEEESDEEPEAAAVEYPEQRFEAEALNVSVSVRAPEGAFPAGTTMEIKRVWDRDTLSDIRDTVEEDFVAVKRVTAVDITFRDADGNEIEPLIPIEVAISVSEIRSEQSAVVVHMDDAGATQIVEQTGEAAVVAGTTELTVEMPAGDAAEPAAETPVAVTETETEPEAETESGDDEALTVDEAEATVEESAEITFESDEFSIYAVVVTETLETRFIAADGETYNIKLTYGPEANIPAGAQLHVQELAGDALLDQAEAALPEGERIAMARFFDISILSEGVEIEPAVPVEVSVALDAYADGQVRAVHIDDGGAVDLIDADQADAGVVFSAESFSVYGVVFTVDGVEGNQYDLNINGNNHVLLSTLLKRMGADAHFGIEDVASVTSSDPELVSVAEEEGETDWRVSAPGPFLGTVALTVTLNNGTEHTINITFDTYQDLKAFLTKVEIVDNSEVIGTSEDTDKTAQVRRNRKYELSLTFNEVEEGIQFIDTGVMRFVLPEGIELPADERNEAEFTIRLDNKGRKLEHNKATYHPAEKDADGNVIAKAYIDVQWNENGGDDYERLTWSGNASFKLNYKVTIDTDVEQLDFGDTFTIPVEEDPDFTATPTKIVEYDKTNNVAHYTVVIETDGTARDLTVKDVLGKAMHYDPNKVTVTYTNANGYPLSADAYPEENVSEPVFTTTEDGKKAFTLTIDKIMGGHKAVLTYDAKVDFSQLDQNTVVEYTTNNVTVSAPNVEPVSSSVELSHEVEYLQIKKKPGAKVELPGENAYLVPWTITYNPERKVSVVGAKLTDTIYTGATNAAKYYSDADYPFKVEIYSDGTYTPTTTDAETGKVTEWTFAGTTLVDTLTKQFSDDDINVTDYEGVITSHAENPDTYTSWEWSIPMLGSIDEKYTYVITYYTKVFPEQASDSFFGNRVEEEKAGDHYDGSHGITHTTTDPLVLEKQILETEADGSKVENGYIKWQIKFERRNDSVPRAVVEDTLPRDGNYRDAFVNDATHPLTVEGLYDDEFYDGPNVTDNGRVIFTFYYDKNQDPKTYGLKGKDDTHQEVVITYYTKNDVNWVKATEEGQASTEHTNSVRLVLGSGEARHTVTATPRNPALVKSGEKVGEIVSANGIPQPVYRYTLKIQGLGDDMFDSAGNLVIHDVFDNYFTRISATDLRAKPTSKETANGGEYYTGSVDGKSECLRPTIEVEGRENATIPVTIEDDTANHSLTFTVKHYDRENGGYDPWARWLKQKKDGTYTDTVVYDYNYEIVYYLMIDEDDLQTLARRQYEADEAIINNPASTEKEKDDAIRNGGVKQLTNTATLNGTSVTLDSGEVDVDVNVRPISKTARRIDGTELFEYTIVINELKLELNGGVPYPMEDSYQNLAVDFSDMSFETDPADAKDKIDYTYHNNVGTFMLPDSTKIVIKYKAWPVGSRGDIVDMTNTASVRSYASVATNNVTLEADHEGVAEVYGVHVKKYANDNMNRPLAGAVFQLFKLKKDGSGEKEAVTYAAAHQSDTESPDWLVGEGNEATTLKMDNGNPYPTQKNHNIGDNIYFITGDDGIADIILAQSRDGLTLRKEVMYFLREVRAPEGYMPEHTDWQFIISDHDDFPNYVYINDNTLQVANPSEKRGLVVEKDFIDYTGLVSYYTYQKYVEFEIVGKNDGKEFYHKSVKYGDFKVVDEPDPTDSNKFVRTYKLILEPDELKAGTYTVTEKAETADVPNTQRTTTYTLKQGTSSSTGDTNVATFTWDGTDDKEVDIHFTNTYRDTVTEKVKVVVKKTWVGETTHPDSVTFDLYRTTEDISGKDAAALRKLVSDNYLSPVKAEGGSAMVLNASNDWSWQGEFAARDKDDDGAKEYHYFALEREMEGYADSYEIKVVSATAPETKATHTTTITNTSVTPTTSFTFGKLWAGPDASRHKNTLVWPNDREITLTIHRREEDRNGEVDPGFALVFKVSKGADGKLAAVYDANGSKGWTTDKPDPVLQVLNAGNYNHYQFKLDNLPKYKSEGKKWQYYVVEDDGDTENAELTFDQRFGFIDGIITEVTDWADAASREQPTDSNTLLIVENIINRAVPRPKYTIKVQKLFSSDRHYKADEFTFELYRKVKASTATDSDETRDEHIAYAKTDAKGVATFENVTIDMTKGLSYHSVKKTTVNGTVKYVQEPYFDGTYTYYIREVQPGQENSDTDDTVTQAAINGITFNDAVATIDYKVTLDWLTGAITAERTVTGEGEVDIVEDSAASGTEPSGAETGSAAKPEKAVKFTNQYDEGKRPLTLTKLWDDDGNRDGLRGNVKFKVMCKTDSGVEIQREYTLNVGNKDTAPKSVTTVNVPVFIDSVPVTSYTVDEIEYPDGDGKYVKISGSETISVTPEADYKEGKLEPVSIAFTAENKHTIETITFVQFTKTWSDDSNRDNYRPALKDYLKCLQLYGDRSVGEIPVPSDNAKVEDNRVTYYAPGAEQNEGNIILDATASGNAYTVTFYKGMFATTDKEGVKSAKKTLKSLPKYRDQGTPISYYVVEKAIEHYNTAQVESTKASEAPYEVALTNTHNLDTATVTLTKKWNDANNQDGVRPGRNGTSYLKYVKLYADNTLVYDGSRDAPWITNDIFTTDVVNKIPASVDIQGTDRNDADYVVTFSNLPKNRVGQNGVPIVYTVAELTIPGYALVNQAADTQLVLTDGAVTIENRRVPNPDVVSVRVNKAWAEDDGIDVALKTAKVKLVAQRQNGTEITDFSNWTGYTVPDEKTVSAASPTAIWTNLPRFLPGAEGVALYYKVVETEVPDGYVVSYNPTAAQTATSADQEITLRVTNTYEKAEIKAIKNWDDAHNQDGLRASVTTHLQWKKQGDSAYKDLKVGDFSVLGADYPFEQTLTTDESASVTWTNLPLYKDGVRVIYRVAEDALANYTLTTTEENRVAVPAEGKTNGAHCAEVTLTNWHVPRADVSLSFTKTWENKGDLSHLKNAQAYKGFLHLYASAESDAPAEVGDDASSIAPGWRDHLNVIAGQDGQYTVTITGLPYYMPGRQGKPVTYYLVEDEVPGYTGSGSTAIGGKPAILDGETLTNTRKTTSLSVSKRVTSDLAADKTRTFTFTVKASVDLTGSYAIKGSAETIRFENREATVTLKHNETVTIEGLPTDVTYTVTETPDDGFTTKVTAGGVTDDKNAYDVEVGDDDTVLHAVAFTNTRKTGNLVVTKRVVSGVPSDADHEFMFRVTLSDETISKTYSGVKFTGGVSEIIRLKDGDSKRIEGLPTDVGYAVEEIDNANAREKKFLSFFTPASNVAEDATIATGDNEATVTNTRKYVPVSLSKVDYNTGRPLSEAKFNLKWSENGADKTLNLTSGTDGVMTAVEAVDGDRVRAEAGSDKLMLATGSYALVETDAPAGFKKLIGDVTITVDGDFNVSIEIPKQSGKTVEATKPTAMTSDESIVTVKVPNLPGNDFPATGGPGTLPYTVAGAALLALAILLLLKRRSA